MSECHLDTCRKGYRFSAPLQEFLFEKIGDILRVKGREDLHSIGKSNVLHRDHRNYVDLAGERFRPRIQAAVDLYLGEWFVLKSLTVLP